MEKSKVLEPSDQDLFRYEREIKSSHNMFSTGYVRVEVYDGKYQRYLLVNRHTAESMRSTNIEEFKLAQKGLASALKRACLEPDSEYTDKYINVNEDRIVLSSRIEYL